MIDELNLDYLPLPVVDLAWLRHYRWQLTASMVVVVVVLGVVVLNMALYAALVPTVCCGVVLGAVIGSLFITRMVVSRKVAEAQSMLDDLTRRLRAGDN